MDFDGARTPDRSATAESEAATESDTGSAAPADRGPGPAVREFVENARADLADLALELVGYDTQNPPGETSAVVDFLEEYFGDLGYGVRRIAADPAKPNLVATLPGDSDWTLAFNGHVDTVPYDRGQWSRDPLGERDGDRLYGRGATDMKGPLAAMLVAARWFAAGDPPPVSVRFDVVSDEETGGDAGLSYLLEADVVEADACVIGETTCERGRHSVTVADRGSIWLTLEARGEAAHGSRPMLGVNAIDRVYEAADRIRRRVGGRRLALDPAIRAVVEESVEYYQPTLGDSAAALFEYPTVNLGTIAGGDVVNSVPERARASLDVRVTAGVETGDILGDVRECVAECEGVTIVDVAWSVGSFTDPSHPVASATSDLAAAVTGDRVYRRSATGGGDAKKLREAGIPTVEFALGTDTVHAVDEYTTLPALSETAQVYAGLPAAIARRL
jgi:succinyl-diaminopimelate desuccinylase